MNRPSRDYREHLRGALHLFASKEELDCILMGKAKRVSYLSMDDLEAAYELVMHIDPREPAQRLDYHTVRWSAPV